MSEFSSDINKLALKNFYETHKEEYFKRRNSGDKKLWDEQYKWDILPRLNKELAEFDKITKDNVGEFISIITQNKNKSNFANWRDAVDLMPVFSKPNGYQVLNEVWTSDIDNIKESINFANDMTKLFMWEKKFNPSTWAYILAAKDCNKFALYRDSICIEVIDINSPAKTKGLSQGEKYQILNDSAIYLGQLIQEDKGNNETYSQTALNGQDFLWVTITA